MREFITSMKDLQGNGVNDGLAKTTMTDRVFVADRIHAG
jgi:hypothetical protein